MQLSQFDCFIAVTRFWIPIAKQECPMGYIYTFFPSTCLNRLLNVLFHLSGTLLHNMIKHISLNIMCYIVVVFIGTFFIFSQEFCPFVSVWDTKRFEILWIRLLHSTYRRFVTKRSYKRMNGFCSCVWITIKQHPGII